MDSCEIIEQAEEELRQVVAGTLKLEHARWLESGIYEGDTVYYVCLADGETELITAD